jgi:3-hydroxyisobutyrate dehydrogenase
MVGALQADFDAVKPILEVMGRRIVRCGDHGAGQAAKVCNNMILGVSMIAVCEAFVLGEKLGLSHQVLFDVASNASGQCWSLTTNCPVPGPVPSSPANRDYQPGFAGALMAKDLRLAVNAVEGTGVAAEMGRLASKIYDDFAEQGGAARDFSGIITDIREKSGG